MLNTLTLKYYLIEVANKIVKPESCITKLLTADKFANCLAH